MITWSQPLACVQPRLVGCLMDDLLTDAFPAISKQGTAMPGPTIMWKSWRFQTSHVRHGTAGVRARGTASPSTDLHFIRAVSSLSMLGGLSHFTPTFVGTLLT